MRAIMVDISPSVIELQIKVAHLEHTLEQLNAVVSEQSYEIQTLHAKLALIYQSLDDTPQVSLFDVLKERPPHY